MHSYFALMTAALKHEQRISYGSCHEFLYMISDLVLFKNK